MWGWIPFLKVYVKNQLKINQPHVSSCIWMTWKPFPFHLCHLVKTLACGLTWPYKLGNKRPGLKICVCYLLAYGHWSGADKVERKCILSGNKCLCLLFIWLFASAQPLTPSSHSNCERNAQICFPASPPTTRLSLSLLTAEAIDCAYWRTRLELQPIGSSWCSAIRKSSNEARAPHSSAQARLRQPTSNLFFFFLPLPPHSFSCSSSAWLRTRI